MILITKIRKLLEINLGVDKNVFLSCVVARVTFNNNNNNNNNNDNDNDNTKPYWNQKVIIFIFAPFMQKFRAVSSI